MESSHAHAHVKLVNQHPKDFLIDLAIELGVHILCTVQQN